MLLRLGVDWSVYDSITLLSLKCTRNLIIPQFSCVFIFSDSFPFAGNLFKERGSAQRDRDNWNHCNAKCKMRCENVIGGIVWKRASHSVNLRWKLLSGNSKPFLHSSELLVDGNSNYVKYRISIALFEFSQRNIELNLFMRWNGMIPLHDDVKYKLQSKTKFDLNLCGCLDLVREIPRELTTQFMLLLL